MSEDIKITKDDLVLWLDRSPSNDDLDLCSYLSNAVENQYKYYQELTNLKAIEKEHQRMNGELREENKQYKNIIDELEKWLEEEIKQYDNVGLKLKKQGNFECASRSYDYLKQYQTMLSKFKKLKGENNDNN